jgi:hypothetical protein
LNHAIETWPVDQFEGLLLSREKTAGCAFHILHNSAGLFHGEIILLDRKDGKIDEKPEIPDLSVLLSDVFIISVHLFLRRR